MIQPKKLFWRLTLSIEAYYTGKIKVPNDIIDIVQYGDGGPTSYNETTSKDDAQLRVDEKNNEMDNYFKDEAGTSSYDYFYELYQVTHFPFIMCKKSKDTPSQEVCDKHNITKKGYFILRNSWSRHWGDCGYVYIDYQYLKKYAYGLARISYGYRP